MTHVHGRPLRGLRPCCASALALAAGQSRPLAADAGAAAQPRRHADQFNDSHFHLTNYIQEGTDVRNSSRSWGRGSGGRRCSAFRCSRRGRYGNTGDFAPTYYLQTDAPLYYYSFTDAFIAMAYRSLPPAAAGALRPDDHRVQSGRHVCRRSHPARADDVPRRVLRHRRVHHPQGVRLVEGRRRDGEPDQSRARPNPGFRRRGRAGRDPPQRHRHAVPARRTRSRISWRR